jgi:hypothetical protein
MSCWALYLFPTLFRWSAVNGQTGVSSTGDSALLQQSVASCRGVRDLWWVMGARVELIMHDWCA